MTAPRLGVFTISSAAVSRWHRGRAVFPAVSSVLAFAHGSSAFTGYEFPGRAFLHGCGHPFACRGSLENCRSGAGKNLRTIHFCSKIHLLQCGHIGLRVDV